MKKIKKQFTLNSKLNNNKSYYLKKFKGKK